MSGKKDRKNKQSFGEKIFSKLGRRYQDKQEKKKQNKADKNKHGPKKATKNVTVTAPKSKVLKEFYTVTDVIRYESKVIRNVNDEKRKHLVTEKLRLCSVRFDFTTMFEEHIQSQNEAQKLSDKKKMDGINPALIATHSNRIQRTLSQQERHVRDQITIGIDKKRQMLVEIVEFISTQKWWDEDILRELIHCVTANLFRTLPLRSTRKSVKGDEEEEAFLDPEWLHLQLVYELCLRFLISNDIDKKVMQKYLHGAFVLRLIQLFQSQDLRERDYLKTILHRIYGRFMPLRQQIRTEIANECYRYVYGEHRMFHGIAEFLDIFSSIINGFSIPVKEEHKAFLRNVLLPLHKCYKYEYYFQQLADCCVLFVNKDQTIATTVLAGLLKFWPRLSPTKQEFFLREMLNVIGALVEHENGFSFPKYRGIVLLCVNKIFECMESPHFQVANQALSLWKDTVMLYLSKCQKDMIWRRLFIIFKDIELNHWNHNVQNLCKEVVVYYERIDSAYWQQLKEEYDKDAMATPPLKDGTRNRSNDIYTMSNGADHEALSKTESESARARSNALKKAVPATLVPHEYRKERRRQRERRDADRQSKYESLRRIGDQNKMKLSSRDSPTKDSHSTPTHKEDGDDDEKASAHRAKDEVIENSDHNDSVGDGAADTSTTTSSPTTQNGT